MTLPSLAFLPDPAWITPDQTACEALWDKYRMMPHIRAHCRKVAEVALALAALAEERGQPVPDHAGILAAALLHDLAKTYTIAHGGSHAQLGAAWVVAETGHHLLAQAVLHHVSWPWDEGPLAVDRVPLCLPLLISYADKRVRHADCVSLAERFDDLFQRYGKTEQSRRHLILNQRQTVRQEQALSQLLGFPLHESTLDSGRLVA